MWVVLYIYFGFLLIAVMVWAFKFRYLQTSVQIAGGTLLATLLFDVFAAYLLSRNTNNNFLYHILIPIQFALFSLMYFKELSGSNARKTFLVSIPLFIIAALFLSIEVQPINEYNSYARLLKNMLITSWALLYYIEVFLSLRVRQLNTEPMFWITSGLFFYSIGNVFVDGLMNYLLAHSDKWAVPIYYVNIFLGILLNITFLLSFFFSKKDPFSQGLPRAGK